MKEGVVTREARKEFMGVAVQPRFRPGSGVLAGIMAGVLFLAMQMALVGAFGGGSIWEPLRMIAAIALGSEVLPGVTAGVDVLVIITGLAVHLGLSIVFGLTAAALVHLMGGWIGSRTTGIGAAAILGALFGLALYGINFYGFAGTFPWFADARDWITIISHVAFGVVAALAYERMAKPEYILRQDEAARPQNAWSDNGSDQ